MSGIIAGTGRSGTTGWNNAGRWRINLTNLQSQEDRDLGMRQLEIIKSNYGPVGEKIRLQYEPNPGVFIPERIGSSVRRAVAAAPIDEAFMRCLDAVKEQGRRIGTATGRGYAPSEFEGMPEAAGHKSPALALAMKRLLSDKRIKVIPFGPPSKCGTQLVRA